jgi:hypothetical protein
MKRSCYKCGSRLSARPAVPSSRTTKHWRPSMISTRCGNTGSSPSWTGIGSWPAGVSGEMTDGSSDVHGRSSKDHFLPFWHRLSLSSFMQYSTYRLEASSSISPHISKVHGFNHRTVEVRVDLGCYSCPILYGMSEHTRNRFTKLLSIRRTGTDRLHIEESKRSVAHCMDCG